MNNETKLLKLLYMTHQDGLNKLAIHKRKKKGQHFLSISHLYLHTLQMAKFKLG